VLTEDKEIEEREAVLGSVFLVARLAKGKGQRMTIISIVTKGWKETFMGRRQRRGGVGLAHLNTRGRVRLFSATSASLMGVSK